MRTLFWVLMVMAWGCGEGLDTAEVEQQAGGICPPWSCANSDEVIHYGMHEANLYGVANAQGLSLQSSAQGRAQIYADDGTAYDLHVEDGRLRGVRPGRPPLEGAALLHATLVVMQGATPLFVIHVKRVRTIKYPVGDLDPLEVYQLTWSEPGEPIGHKNVCNGYDPHAREVDLLGMLPDETLVFEGDRFNPKKMTVSANADPAWFNFGCATHTLAKLRLTRNTIAHNPAWQARQATFKMLVADYCGNGVPFTVAGTPLRWMGGLVHYYDKPQTIEARWTENGAACVGTPRLEAYPSELFSPNVWTKIHAVCAPAPCTNGALEDLDGALRISAIPY